MDVFGGHYSTTTDLSLVPKDSSPSHVLKSFSPSQHPPKSKPMAEEESPLPHSPFRVCLTVQYFWKRSHQSIERNANNIKCYREKRSKFLSCSKSVAFRVPSFFFWPHRAACGILVPQPGLEPGPSVKALSPNHWTARVPSIEATAARFFLFILSQVFFVQRDVCLLFSYTHIMLIKMHLIFFLLKFF